MLMTVIKKQEEIMEQVKGKIFVVTCFGCKEVNFSKAEEEAEALFEVFKDHDRLTGVMHTDYICNEGYFEARFLMLPLCLLLFLSSSHVQFQTFKPGSFALKRLCRFSLQITFLKAPL